MPFIALHFRTGLLFALSCILAASLASAHAEDDGFADIFNGKDLKDWVVEGQAKYLDRDGAEKPTWTVEDGMLVCAESPKSYGFIRFDKQKFGDFALHLEYRLSKLCNSGVGIRTAPFVAGDLDTQASRVAYEVQILDDGGRKPDTNSHGALCTYVAPTSNEGKQPNEWNTMDIECKGPKIKVSLNGKVVQDIDQTTIPEIKDKPLSGYISLQNHGYKIEYRSVRIKDLSGLQEK